MSDYLLAAIREQPDDDLARLAYADRLEETGDGDRASFIRLQMQLDRQPIRSQRAGELVAECEAMLAERERLWLGEWADRLVRWTFRRGFLDSVTLEPEVFVLFGKELFETHPIREVRFVRSDGDTAGGDIAGEVIACPHFAWVRALNISGATPSAAPDWCEALAQASHLTRLEELNLSSAWQQGGVFNEFSALEDLCQSEHLATLKKLDLSSPLAADPFGDEGIALLAGAPFLPNLTSLNLGGWNLSDDGLRTLLGLRDIGNIEELDLSWCEQLTSEGLQTLLDSKRLPKLQMLSLGGDIDVAALAHSSLLGQIERLDLCTAATRHFRTFSAPAWRELADSPHVGKLRRLTLLHGLLDAAGFAALFGATSRLRLHALMVMGGPLDGEKTAQTLAESPALADLTALEFIACHLDSDGVVALMKAPFVPELRQFCVAGNRIGERGLQALMRSPLARGSLDDLHLHHCELSAGELKKLFGWRGLGSVTRLELGSNEVNLEVMNAMLGSRHLGRLTTLHMGSGEMDTEALLALARSSALPRLRDLTVGASADPEAIEALRQRFGARLKLDPRG